MKWIIKEKSNKYYKEKYNLVNENSELDFSLYLWANDTYKVGKSDTYFGLISLEAKTLEDAKEEAIEKIKNKIEEEIKEEYEEIKKMEKKIKEKESLKKRIEGLKKEFKKEMEFYCIK